MYFRVMLSVLGVLMCAGIVHAAPFAYIANNADNTVSVLDTASNQVTAVINVGQSPYGVAVNRMGSRVYVSNQGDNTISVIDTMDNSVTSIPLSAQPGALAVNSAGTRLFVANPDADTVSIFNTLTKQPDATPTVALSVDCQPQGIAAGPADGSGNYNVYVACGSGQIDIINATSSSYIKSATEVALTNILPQGIAVSKDGKRVYVVGSMSVALLDTSSLGSTPTAVLTDAAFSWLTGIAADPTVANSDAPNAVKLYVTDTPTDKIHVVTATGNALAYSSSLVAGSGPWGIAYTADGAKAVASNFNFSQLTPGTVTVVQSANNAVTTTDGGPTQFIGRVPKSFGTFAGPNFATIATSVTGYNCGTISTAEIVTPDVSGAYKVPTGQDITFNINTDANCALTDVQVDSSSVGTPTTRLFPAVSADHTLSATYTRNNWITAVVKPAENTGTGTITSQIFQGGTFVSGGGINCGGTCSGTNPTGTILRLTATPSADSSFDGWQGVCNGKLTCDITLNSTQAVLKGAESGTFTAITVFTKKTSGPVRRGRATPAYSQTFAEAYTAAASGDVIDLLTFSTGTTPFTLPSGFNLAKSVIIEGGWTEYNTTAPDYGLLPAGSKTTVQGPITVYSGSVTIGSTKNGGLIIK